MTLYNKEQKKKLQLEIIAKKKELALLKKQEVKHQRGDAVKPLEEFTSKEKIQAFDHLYEIAEEDLRKAEKRTGPDVPWYAWEQLLTTLLGRGRDKRNRDKFWKYYNSLNE